MPQTVHSNENQHTQQEETITLEKKKKEPNFVVDPMQGRNKSPEQLHDEAK